MNKDRHARIGVNCENCGNSFSSRRERVEKGMGKFCSELCYNEWQRENVRSERIGRENARLYHKQTGGYFVQWVQDNRKPKNEPWHSWAWEMAFGEIPLGYVVEYKDGNKDNISLENLQLRLTQSGKKMLPKKEKVLSEAHKKKIAEATRKRWEAGDFDKPEIRKAYSESGKASKGRIYNPLSKDRIRQSLTEEEVEKIRNEGNKKRSNALKGRVFSDEHLQKLITSVRERVANGTHNFLRGGKRENYTPYPQEFSKYIKLKVKHRDEFLCQSCGRNVYGERSGHVHHMDGNKQNCDIENLLLLCATCHNAVHGRNTITNEVIEYLKTLLIHGRG